MDKKLEDLYGLDVDPKKWINMSYPQVLRYKIELANKRVESLYKANLLWRDNVNISRCKKAIGFNYKLLRELK